MSISLGDMLKDCGKVNSGDIAEIMRQSNELLKTIKDAVKEHGDAIKDMADQDEKLFKDIIDELKSTRRTSSRVKGKVGTSGFDSAKLLTALRKRDDHSKKTMGTLDKALAAMTEGINKQAAGIEKLVSTGGKRLGSTGKGGGGSRISGPDSTKYADEFAENLGDAIKNTVGSVLTGLLGGAAALQLLTSGMVDQEYEYAIGMNQILFLTKGIGDEAKDMQKTFRKTNDVVATTGFDLTTFQNQMMKAAKLGLKNAEAITRTGLNLGKMMGLSEQESSGIADNMGEWNKHLGMSEHSIADVARGIQQTAHLTGMTGQNLAEVVKNSEKFMDMMRSAGQLTSESAKNIIDLQAAATKLGVAESMSDSMAAMSNNATLFLKASKETQSLMFMSASSVGRMAELQKGTLLQTKGGMKDMARGLENTFKKFSGGQGFGQIDKMDAGQKATLNLQLNAAFGKGLDDMKREFDALNIGGKMFADKMADIDKEMQGHLTKEERLSLERKKQDLLLNQSLSFSSGLADAVKDANSFDDAITKMKKGLTEEQWKEKTTDLANLAGNFSQELKDKVLSGDNKGIAQAMAMSASKALAKSGGKDFSKDVSAAISSNDFEKLRELQSQMSKEQQKLAVKSVEELDPIGQAAFYLKGINEDIRGFVGPAVVALTGILGGAGIMIGYLATIAAQGYMSYQSLKSGFEVFKSLGMTGNFKGISDMFGKLTSLKPGLLGRLSELFGMLGNFKLAGIGSALAGVFSTIGTAIMGALSTIGPWIMTTLVPTIISAVSGLFSTVLPFLIAGFLPFLLILGKVLLVVALVVGAVALLWQVFKKLWGIIKAIGGLIWDVMLGIWDIVVQVFEPFKELFAAIGEIFSSTGEESTFFADCLKEIGANFKWVANIIGKVLGFLVSVVLKPFINVISGVAKLVKGIMNFDGAMIMEGLKKIFYDTPAFFAGLIKTAFLAVFVDLPTWLGGVIMTGLTAIFYDLPVWLGGVIIDGLTAIFVTFPTMVYDGFVSALSGVWEYIKSWIPGLKGATETSEQRDQRISTEGASLTNGAGGIVGGLLGGDLGKAWGGVKEIGSAINPFNWFADGTREIQNTGLGVLHKGEAVIPAEELEKLTAKGNGAFGSIGEALGSAFNSLNPFAGLMEHIGMGAFAPGLGKEAGYMATMQSAGGEVAEQDSVPALLKDILGVLRKGNKKGQSSSSNTLLANATAEKEVNSMVSEAAKITDKVFDKGLNTISENFSKKATATEQKSDSFIDRAINTAREVIRTVWDSISGTAETHESAAAVSSERSHTALEAAKNSLIQTTANTSQATAESMMEQSLIQNAANTTSDPHSMSLNALAAQHSKSVTGMSNSVENKYSQLNSSADGLVVPSAVRDGDTTTSSVNPVSLTDIHSRVQQDNATTQNEAKKSLPELSSLVMVNESQLSYLMMLHDDFKTLIDLMGPSKLSGNTSFGGTPDTRSVTSPVSSPNYHYWQFGKYQQGASKQVVTDGR